MTTVNNAINNNLQAALNMNSNQINNVTDPTLNQDAATKNYVDMIAAGLNPAQAVSVATTANIPGTYNNGTGGIGATYTITATGALTIDGVLTVQGNRYLLKDLSTGAWNGIYTLTTAGSGGVSPIFTRATDYNQPANINNTGVIPVLAGTVNATTLWVQTAKVTTVGTDALSFSKFGNVPLAIPISIANGGTAVSSVTTSPTASAWAAWDANKNLSANNLLEGYTTTATAGITTTLTVSSTYTQVFTGSTTQTVQLPVTSTLVLGQSFYIINNSTGVVTVVSSGGNTLLTLPANSTGYVTCILTSGTTAASWYADATGAGTDLFPNGTVVVTNSTQTIVNGTCYVADAAGIVTFTLPGANVGSYFAIAGMNGWTLNIGNGINATVGNVTLVGGASSTWSASGVSETVIFQWIGANVLQAFSWTGLPVTNGGLTPLPIAAGSNIAITRSGSNMSIATSGVPVLASNNAFTAQNGITPVAITSSSNVTAWNLNTAPNATYAAVENSVLANPTNQVAGTYYTIKFVQNGSAAKTFTTNTAYKYPQGVVPVVSTTLSAIDIYTYYSDGTNMLCVGIAQNIS